MGGSEGGVGGEGGLSGKFVTVSYRNCAMLYAQRTDMLHCHKISMHKTYLALGHLTSCCKESRYCITAGCSIALVTM